MNQPLRVTEAGSCHPARMPAMCASAGTPGSSRVRPGRSARPSTCSAPVPLQNVATWSDLGISVTRLGGSVVLVDHAAEHLPAQHRRVQRHDARLVLAGRPLVPRLVRPVPVIVPGVGPQHCPQMGFTVDQHPVRALEPDGPYPAWPVRCGRSCMRPRSTPHPVAPARPGDSS